MKKLLIICGPTASGKTSLAIECAKLLNSEIISADSMNIYSGLDIGTAKPTKDEQSQIKHHLIDVVSAEKSFSVGDYRELAKPIVDDLLDKGKTPIICGGTGFYINSLIYNLSYGKSTGNLLVRQKYNDLALKFGNEYVYNILKEKDIETAKKLHFNDLKRVIRALEIYESGIKKSDIKDDYSLAYDYDAYSFDYDRNSLYERINCRVNLMIENGLITEVEQLIKNGITNENQCMQGIGYKEIYSYLKGDISKEDAIELIKLNTRHYAKRQITFFKKLPNIKFIKPSNISEIAKRIVESL
ncbi:MAG: tRNA (adenosine(37)-N6)-dimethylallyltransferase MiaA [Clostridia bacterium]|nr:tRNA (adenosine(37)-N6)-dimethylallyltransferase MiaA [Clostridia bacterium]